MSRLGANLTRIALVVHPSRDIERTLDAIRAWAGEQDVELVQPVGAPDERREAPPGAVADCDVVVAVGGDGTMLTAMHAAVGPGLPVLGIACGSLGVLMTTAARHTTASLERFAAGDWTPRSMPALEVIADRLHPITAFNDVAITRRGQSQVTAAAEADGVLYARFVGDGFVVSTPVGSSAYTLAAGGPVLAPDSEAFVLTPLAAHGGSVPPLVAGHSSVMRVRIEPGFGGIRLEVDGRLMDPEPALLEVRLRPAVATIVGFDGQEPLFTGLRRRQLIADSPRVLARDKREAG